MSVSVADQDFRPFIETLEIVRGIKQVGSPIIAEPAHVGLNRIDIFLLFLGGVGVVEPQVASPGKLLRDAEIERDRLGMADVQVTIRLRREARHDLAVFLDVEIGLDDVANEIAACLRRHWLCCHSGSCSDQADVLPNPRVPWQGFSEDFSYVWFLLYTTASSAGPHCPLSR